MKIKKMIIAIVILGVLFTAYKVYDANTPGKYDTLVQCITKSDAKMYGAFWCPHCNNQKQMLGKSAQYLPYIECSQPNRVQTEICNKANITSYPTWEFKSGERIIGELTPEKLSQLSGCPLP